MQYFTINFICPFDMMKHYPFDIQECHGTIAPRTNRDFLVKLLGKELIYNGPRDLKNYVLIGNITYTQTNEVKPKFICSLS